MRYDSGVFQHAQEHAVDGPRGVFCITGESVRVHAESVHVLAVAHKVFDLPSGQRLDNVWRSSYKLQGVKPLAVQ